MARGACRMRVSKTFPAMLRTGVKLKFGVGFEPPPAMSTQVKLRLPARAPAGVFFPHANGRLLWTTGRLRVFDPCQPTTSCKGNIFGFMWIASPLAICDKVSPELPL
ncbi:hypothetical protein GWK47_003845 [Chionoecetes opilio]|uniref:Uncharacterized protein n=1 Tax=Chionoecetes opilio TaxID=41210 RepID=A0A8J4YPT2_CHIOP|nr:hypothetical protein GWK47_003845 [Chionoecetes opilio]